MSPLRLIRTVLLFLGLCAAAQAQTTATSTSTAAAAAEQDGYLLWLDYAPLSPQLVHRYIHSFDGGIVADGTAPTLQAARTELKRGLGGMLGLAPAVGRVGSDGILLIGTDLNPEIKKLHLPLAGLGREGFLLRSMTVHGHRAIVLAAQADTGLLYGAFDLLQRLQRGEDVARLDVVSVPKIRYRVLDHWDNLDRTVERGYAGPSLWDWFTLPDYADPRYTDYARANAAIGINGVVLNNVNTQPEILTPRYLAKERALADRFRPWGIRVYLSVRFSAPMDLGGLKTADPADPAVQAWWRAKTDEIYRLIPDFGGYLVKANSEGQPGPQNYGRSHADGANMLAAALAPHDGIVMWRAFVYADDPKTDRIMQAYNEFKPLDGVFLPNVILQVKNGPLDFQPREPFHPLFGALPHTNTGLEVQITKEYLGFNTHLVYLGPLFQEALQADTFANGPGTTVAQVVEDKGFGRAGARSLIAGVANVGSDENWCGAIFNQANWYAFGRLAWDPEANAEAIARAWTEQTFRTAGADTDRIVRIMMMSREAAVDYMTPLGLAHQMGTGHHYGPAPWVDDAGRADWNPVYYNRADAGGIGVDRTETGSNALGQYAPGAQRALAANDAYLLWFRHQPWDRPMASGRTLWAELIHHYDAGVAAVAQMQSLWAEESGTVDAARFTQTAAFFVIQAREAQWWRDASIAYFQSVNGLPLPAGVTPPAHPLEYYKALKFPYAPGQPH